jgi:transketolase
VRHGGLRAFGSTFTVFSDYARPSIRLAALSEAAVIYQFTHDSIGVGEDGPTHQPVEHLATLRAMPNCTVVRPSDANEAREAWRAAMLNVEGPTAIVCSRQKLPVLERNESAPAELLHKGAYVLCDPEEGEPDVILMASGSEVARVLQAAELLAEEGIGARVVAFPCWELFEQQPQDYRRSVLPPSLRRRLVVEAGSPTGWHRYAGDEGEVLALERFGASGPGEEVLNGLGFAVDEIAAKARALVGRD